MQYGRGTYRSRNESEIPSRISIANQNRSIVHLKRRKIRSNQGQRPFHPYSLLLSCKYAYKSLKTHLLHITCIHKASDVVECFVKNINVRCFAFWMSVRDALRLTYHNLGCRWRALPPNESMLVLTLLVLRHSAVNAQQKRICLSCKWQTSCVNRIEQIRMSAYQSVLCDRNGWHKHICTLVWYVRWTPWRVLFGTLYTCENFPLIRKKKKPTDCILSSIYIFIVVFEQNVCVALFRIGMDAAASQMRLDIQRNFIGISSSLQTSHLLIKDFLIRRPTKLMCLRAFFPLKKTKNHLKCQMFWR